MKKEVLNTGICVITADNGLWLTDGESFGSTVITQNTPDKINRWTEVTDEYKQQREAEMLAEMESEEYMESEEPLPPVIKKPLSAQE